MARRNSLRDNLLAIALAVGVLLVIAFAFVEYGLGAREHATGLDETPSTTETTISDTRDHNDVDPSEPQPLAKP